VRRRAVAPIADLEIFASIEGVTSMVILGFGVAQP
jgi:hypothetical protein